MSSAKRIVQAGGGAIQIGTMAPLLEWNNRTTLDTAVVLHRSFGLPVVFINVRACASAPASAGNDLAVGRVHPRWFRVTRDMAPNLWRSAFPATVPYRAAPFPWHLNE